MTANNEMDIIQEAKAISTEFKEIEAEYSSPDSLIDSGNWYYISKKQDEVISRLVDRLEWKPIDSKIKKSQDEVLLYEEGLYHLASWTTEEKYWTDGTVYIDTMKNGHPARFRKLHIKPTHYMPLPLPPVGDK